MASTNRLLTLISSVSSHYPPIPPPECHWVAQLKPLSVCLEIRFFHAAQAELSVAALSRPANKQLIGGRGRHPKLLANLGVPLEGREAGIRGWHRTVVESQQTEENGRSPVVFHRRGSESRLWNIFSFWVLSVMDYRQPISQAALLPPENFFFFLHFPFPFFLRAVQLCVCLSCHVTRVHNMKHSSPATCRFGCDSSSRSWEQNQRSEWRIAGV